MILAATGHRPDKLGGYGADVALRLFSFAVSVVARKQPTRGISGMALGWDTAFALACLECGVPLTAAVPFATQAARWPAHSRRVWGDILARADRVVILSPPPTSDTLARLAMDVRNRWMVDNCDELLALYNGTKGGTQNCIDYAGLVGRFYSNPWHEWQAWNA